MQYYYHGSAMKDRINKLLSMLKQRSRHYKEYKGFSSYVFYNIFDNFFIPNWLVAEEYYESNFHELTCSDEELYDKYIQHWKDKLDKEWNENDGDIDGLFDDYHLRHGEYESKIKVYNFLRNERFQKEGARIIKEHRGSGLFSESSLDNVDINWGNGPFLGTTLSLLNTWECIFLSDKNEAIGLCIDNAIIYSEDSGAFFFTKQRKIKDKYIFPIYKKEGLVYGAELEDILSEFKYYINDDLTIINELIISHIKLNHNQSYSPTDALIDVNYMTSDCILKSIMSIWSDFAKRIWRNMENNVIKFVLLPEEED